MLHFNDKTIIISWKTAQKKPNLKKVGLTVSCYNSVKRSIYCLDKEKRNSNPPSGLLRTEISPLCN